MDFSSWATVLGDPAAMVAGLFAAVAWGLGFGAAMLALTLLYRH